MFNGLKQRGARWFLRRRVPAQYVEAWGSAEVTRALGTSDYRVARRLLPRVWADLDDEFTASRHSRIRGCLSHEDGRFRPGPEGVSQRPCRPKSQC
ncbi:DUF6538 domain-containing protein [Phenylobacterium sp.]|uniref:DUF6538 domain-containing protein n=1 Tax=Phenylobacterium sp. TaxID=1871053 RepID=UPI003BB57322